MALPRRSVDLTDMLTPSALGINCQSPKSRELGIYATLIFVVIPCPVHTKNTPVQRNHGFLDRECSTYLGPCNGGV